MKKLITFSLLVFTLSNIKAAEVDNFKAQRLNLPDEVDKVNEMANKYISQALTKANRKGSCSEEVLYNELQVYFSNFVSGVLVKNLLSGVDAEIHRYHVKHSIYKDWRFWHGLGLAFKPLGKHELLISPLIKLNDTYIGIDKLEHMFGSGFKYFKKRYHEKQSMKQVLDYGNKLEQYGLGGNRLMSGIFSHGDLSANFNGMRFWNHMLQKGDDVLGVHYNVGPYVACENKKWVKTKIDLDFRNYIDQSMDESVNCSKLPSKNAINRFIDAVKNNGYKGAVCPQNNPKLMELVEKYNSHGIYKYLLNMNGLTKY